MKRSLLVLAFGVALAAPASALAGHGLSAAATALDHPAPFTPPPPPSTDFNSGGPGAQWELVTTIATGNPHTDIDFFTQDGETYVSAGTLGIGPNGGGQTIVQLTEDGEVSPSFVAGHPSADCISRPQRRPRPPARRRGDAEGRRAAQHPQPVRRPRRHPAPDRRHRRRRAAATTRAPPASPAPRRAAWRSSTSPTSPTPSRSASPATSARRTRSTSTPSARTSPTPSPPTRSA